MKKFEQANIFEADDIKALEKEYNDWFRTQVNWHESVPPLKGIPFAVTDRVMTVQKIGNKNRYILAIFYDYYELETTEFGPDKGAGKKIGGVSAFPRT